MLGNRNYKRGRMLHGDRNNQTAETNDDNEIDGIPDWGEETEDENKDWNRDDLSWE